MRYLLDTHIFVWWMDDDKKLKRSYYKKIEDPANTIYVSVVNAWEISIKKRISKLSLKTSLRECFDKSGFEVLNVNLNHIFALDTLPHHHRDPFDRLLVAQAKTENLTLLSADSKLKKYDVRLLI